MPYINVKTSKTLTDSEKTSLKTALGSAITAIPGKTENYLMVCIEDGQSIWFAGKNDRPMAFVDVRILGHAKAEDFSRMTGEVCKAMQAHGVAPADVYVSYAEYENWGWNGRNF